VTEQERPSGILPSNVETIEAVEASTQRRPRRAVLVPILCLLVAAGLGALVMLLFTSSQQPATRRAQAPAQAQQTTQTQTQPQAQAQATPRARAVGIPAPVNGISCDALESTIVHLHVHLAVFFDEDEQLIPYGIGIGEPWQVEPSDAGPFVSDGLCFYWLHTHTEDGVVHIESPVRRTFTLGDFFAIWEQPLSANQVGPKQGLVISYVNGDKVSTAPQDINLTQHAQIQLDVGVDVPPYSFDFPRGD